MKRNIFFLLLTILFMQMSCKNENEVNSTFRIKQKVYSNVNEVDELKYVYSYSDNKLESETVWKKDIVNEQWVEIYINKIKYTGNTITAIASSYNDNTEIWEDVTKTIYLLSNGIVTDIVSYSPNGSNWSNKGDTVSFEYNNSKISEINTYWGFTWIVNYNDGLISDFTVYKQSNNSVKHAYSKCKYSYSGRQLDYIDFYYSDNKNGNVSTTPSSRFGYAYYNNQVVNTSLTTYNISDLNWTNQSYTTYKYNSSGDISEQTEKDGTKITYEYETGVGNASLFRYFTTDLYKQPYSKIIIENELKVSNLNKCFIKN